MKGVILNNSGVFLVQLYQRDDFYVGTFNVENLTVRYRDQDFDLPYPNSKMSGGTLLIKV
ncbi:MAG: hypothetical protein WCJ33_04970 [Pseudomonadota bacterium]